MDAVIPVKTAGKQWGVWNLHESPWEMLPVKDDGSDTRLTFIPFWNPVKNNGIVNAQTHKDYKNKEKDKSSHILETRKQMDSVSIAGNLRKFNSLWVVRNAKSMPGGNPRTSRRCRSWRSWGGCENRSFVEVCLRLVRAPDPFFSTA